MADGQLIGSVYSVNMKSKKACSHKYCKPTNPDLFPRLIRQKLVHSWVKDSKEESVCCEATIS